MRATLTDMAAAPGTPSQAPSRPWRYRRVGAVLLSPDFYVGAPLGCVIALVPTLSVSAAEPVQSVLLGVSATAAALTALVLTAVSVLVGALTPAFGRLLDQMPGGVKTLLRPYLWIVGVSACGCATALVAGLGWPLVEGSWYLRFGAVSLPLALTMWSLAGCVQVVTLTTRTLEQARRADLLEERVQYHLTGSRRSG